MVYIEQLWLFYVYMVYNYGNSMYIWYTYIWYIQNKDEEM